MVIRPNQQQKMLKLCTKKMTTNGSVLKNYAIIKPIHHIILGGAGKVWEALGGTILRQQWHV